MPREDWINRGQPYLWVRVRQAQYKSGQLTIYEDYGHGFFLVAFQDKYGRRQSKIGECGYIARLGNFVVSDELDYYNIITTEKEITDEV